MPDYDVPDKEEADRLGRNVIALIEFNFGKVRGARRKFAALFDRPTASVWPWVHGDRKGLPRQRYEFFKELIKNKQIQLPPDTSINDYVRPPYKRESSGTAKYKNNDLLTLFWNVARHKELGPTALENLMNDENLMMRKRNPSLLLRWAYNKGGVPRSYHGAFSNALIRSNIAQTLLGYDENDPLAIERYEIKVVALNWNGTDEIPDED